VSDATCQVCCGSGRYPVMTIHGRRLRDIVCPECLGDGVDQEAVEQRQDNLISADKFETGSISMESAAWIDDPARPGKKMPVILGRGKSHAHT
jgi:hypothetical protein